MASSVSIDLQPFPQLDKIFVDEQNAELASEKVQYKCYINQDFNINKPVIKNILEAGKCSHLYSPDSIQIIIQLPPESYIYDVMKTQSIAQEIQKWFLVTDQNELYKLSDWNMKQEELIFKYARLYVPLRQRQIIEMESDKMALRSMAEHPRQPMQLFYPLQGFDSSIFPSNRLRMNSLQPPVMKKVEGSLFDPTALNIVEKFGTILRESSQEQLEEMNQNIPFKHYIQKSLINMVSYYSIKDSNKQEFGDNNDIDDTYYIEMKAASDRYLQKYLVNNQKRSDMNDVIVQQQTEISLRNYFKKRRMDLINHCINSIMEARKAIEVKSQQIKQTRTQLQMATRYSLVRPGALTRQLFLNPDAHYRLDQQLALILRGKHVGFYVFCQDNCYIDVRKFKTVKDFNVIFDLYLCQIDKAIYQLVADLTSGITLKDNQNQISARLASILENSVQLINKNQEIQDNISKQINIQPNDTHNQCNYQVQCPDSTISNDFIEKIGIPQNIYYDVQGSDMVNNLRHIYLNQSIYEPDALYIAAEGLL